MSEQHRILNEMYCFPDDRFAIATVIRVEGSAYRRVGAKMIIGESGRTHGMISGGCLEEDLIIRAQSAIQSMKCEIISYDLSSEDDFGWGKGAGCNGNIYVSIEPVSIQSTKIIKELKAAFEAVHDGKEIIRVANISSNESDFFYTDVHGCPLIDNYTDEKKDNVRTMMVTMNKVGEMSQLWSEGDTNWLVERITPKPTVYIFGAGMDAEPLVKQLGGLDFRPVVIDPRRERLTTSIFPNAQSFKWMHYKDFLHQETMIEGSYCLILTHSFQDDRLILDYLMKEPARLRYIGILGPKRRTVRLMPDGEIPEYIHAPIGLDIGAEGAEEIAISIVAELIKVRRSFASQSNKQVVI